MTAVQHSRQLVAHFHSTLRLSAIMQPLDDDARCAVAPSQGFVIESDVHVRLTPIACDRLPEVMRKHIRQI
jgi:hypothetical protein